MKQKVKPNRFQHNKNDNRNVTLVLIFNFSKLVKLILISDVFSPVRFRSSRESPLSKLKRTGKSSKKLTFHV